MLLDSAHSVFFSHFQPGLQPRSALICALQDSASELPKPSVMTFAMGSKQTRPTQEDADRSTVRPRPFFLTVDRRSMFLGVSAHSVSMYVWLKNLCDGNSTSITAMEIYNRKSGAPFLDVPRPRVEGSNSYTTDDTDV